MTMPNTEPTPASSIDADIAAFIAEGNQPEEAPNDADPDGGDDEAADDETAPGSGDADGEAETEDAADEQPAFKVDAAKLAEAVEKKDLVALLAAMGPAAEEMLTSKAHATLRLQVKELKKAQDTAAASEAKAKDLTLKLAEAYGDPIKARKAATEGDVDTFIDMVEKWADRDWDDLMKWVVSGIKGRPERLEARVKEANKGDAQAQEKVKQALEETRTWIQTSLSKSHARFLKDVPGAVDMVLTELRAGHAKGIDSPAKAVTLAIQKLKEQHAQLTRFFETKQQTKKAMKTPVAKVGSATEAERRTRPTTLEEDIADYVKKEGVRR